MAFDFFDFPILSFFFFFSSLPASLILICSTSCYLVVWLVGRVMRMSVRASTCEFGFDGFDMCIFLFLEQSFCTVGSHDGKMI
jgi:hypothetical protein